MLQAAKHGPIYLDRKDDSDTQSWYVNKFINLRDGDEVKFRIAYWPSNFLCEYQELLINQLLWVLSIFPNHRMLSDRKDHD